MGWAGQVSLPQTALDGRQMAQAVSDAGTCCLKRHPEQSEGSRPRVHEIPHFVRNDDDATASIPPRLAISLP
jgi:hypothetical protein